MKWTDPHPDGSPTFWQDYRSRIVNPIYRPGMGWPPFLEFQRGVVIDGRRGPIGKPNRERARRAYLRRRSLQSKDRR